MTDRIAVVARAVWDLLWCRTREARNRRRVAAEHARLAGDRERATLFTATREARNAP